MGMFKRWFGRGQDAPRTEEEAQEEEQKVEDSLAKSRQGFFGQISNLFATDEPITEELWDELEELLIQDHVPGQPHQRPRQPLWHPSGA
jgi:fused signal recognition particle receptor